MALKKQITKKGITAEYHQIHGSKWDKDSNTTIILVRTYVDKNQRDADEKSYLEDFKTSYVLDGIIETRSEQYEQLKNVSDFTEAEDI